MSRGKNSVTVKVNSASIDALFNDLAEALDNGVRPVAQAGAQVLYERVRANVKNSVKPHWFYGENDVYGVGPKGKVIKRSQGGVKFNPGHLKSSIYQVFSEDNSGPGHATYHVSYNADKAPYAHMVEFGTSRMKHGPAHFVTNAISVEPQAVEAMERELLSRLVPVT